MPFPTFSFLPFFVGKDRGFFSNEGLQLDLTVTNGSKDDAEELLSGRVDFTALIPPYVQSGRHSEVRAISGFSNGVVHRLTATKEIGSVRELKGKKVMVNVLGGVSHMETIFVLRRGGLDPSDVKFLEAGPELEVAQVEALKRGEVDAIASSAPFFHIAEKEGFHVVGWAGDVVSEWSPDVLMTSTRLMKEDPDMVKRTVTALSNSVAFCHGDREGTLDEILKNIEYANNDRKLMAEVYDRVRERWTTRLTAKAMQNFLDVYCSETGSAKVDAAALVDTRVLQGLQSVSG